MCCFDLFMALVGRGRKGVVGALKRVGVRQLDGERRAVVSHDGRQRDVFLWYADDGRRARDAREAIAGRSGRRSLDAGRAGGLSQGNRRVWCSGRWTATRDHSTESMAEMSGAGEGVDGGAERCWCRRQWYGLVRCWVGACAARIEVGASASQASERWATSGGHAFALGLRATLGPGWILRTPARRFTIHDSRRSPSHIPTLRDCGLTLRPEPIPAVRASGRGRSDC